MRDKITISNLARTVSIDLPAGYTYTVTDTAAGTAVTMADGSIVYEQYGTRRGVTLTCGYLPQADYTRLLSVARANPFVYAIYTDTDGAEVGGEYRMELGPRALFAITTSGAQWKGPTITLTAREVV